MNVDQVLTDLRTRHGPRLVFYAEDLALLLGESDEVTANLVNSQSLPFSFKLVGNRRCVDIYQLAQWLAGSGLEPVVTQIQAARSNSLKEEHATSDGPGLTPAPVPARTQITNQILAMRHANAGLIAAFSSSLNDKNERLFLTEIIECMVFTERLPAFNFVLTLSTSHVSVGKGTVTEMKWLFGQFDEAVKRTVERWRGPFAAAASRLVLRRGRQVLFRGIVIGIHRQILVDLVGCAEAVDPGSEGSMQS